MFKRRLRQVTLATTEAVPPLSTFRQTAPASQNGLAANHDYPQPASWYHPLAQSPGPDRISLSSPSPETIKRFEELKTLREQQLRTLQPQSAAASPSGHITAFPVDSLTSTPQPMPHWEVDEQHFSRSPVKQALQRIAMWLRNVVVLSVVLFGLSHTAAQLVSYVFRPIE